MTQCEPRTHACLGNAPRGGVRGRGGCEHAAYVQHLHLGQPIQSFAKNGNGVVQWKERKGEAARMARYVTAADRYDAAGKNLALFWQDFSIRRQRKIRPIGPPRRSVSSVGFWSEIRKRARDKNQVNFRILVPKKKQRFAEAVMKARRINQRRN